MRYFIDTEFIEGFHKPLFGKRRHFIELISIAIFCEDGNSYYAVSSEYSYKKADDWVKKNVIEPLYIEQVHGDMRNSLNTKNFHKRIGKSNEKIAKEIKNFIYFEGRYAVSEQTLKLNPTEYINPSFYGYFSDYDWVLLCSLFGRMIDLPEGFPMYCIDLKQFLDQYAAKVVDGSTGVFIKGEPLKADNIKEAIDVIKNLGGYPKQTGEHNALADAKWNYNLFEFLILGWNASNNKESTKIKNE